MAHRADMFDFLASWLKPKEAAVSAQIITNLTKIMSQLDQLETRLSAIGETLTKATGEITTEIAALREALANVDLPASALAALEQLEAKAQALDDIIPDAPGAEEPVGEETPAATEA
jgi:DNA anti-recombination protein RmuC